MSDLEWAAESNGWGPVERDSSNGEADPGDGNPIKIAGVGYDKGLGAHADSAVHVFLGQACDRFTADVGVDDEVGELGSVRFQVYGDGRLLEWTDVLTGGAEAVPLEVSVSGVTALELRVTNARDGDDYDHADWAGPMSIWRRSPRPAPSRSLCSSCCRTCCRSSCSASCCPSWGRSPDSSV
ncbi:MAG: hypothetical protein GEU94_03145 [Micromonosporaceae bacterium]|nr:hypothetical protein [Micromonosporaceae bacterium]